MHGGQGQSLGYLLDAGPIRPVLLGSWFGLTVPWWCWLAHIQHTAIQGGGGGLLGWVCCADGAHVGHWVRGGGGVSQGILMQYFTLGGSKIDVFETCFFDTMIT